MEERKNTFRNVHVLGLGGQWAIAVGIVTDSYGTEKIRIAKGRYKEMAPLKEGELSQSLGDVDEFPISQPNKFNIKRAAEWEAVSTLVEKLLPQLETGGE